MSKMFQGCYNLNNLDLSSFETNKVTKIEGIFLVIPKTYMMIINQNLKNLVMMK